MSVESQPVEQVSELPAGSTTVVHAEKAQKLIQKLGLKRVEGITRVAMRRPKNILLIVNDPIVYKSSNNAFVVLGKITVEDMAAQARAFSENQKKSGAEGAEGAATEEPAPAKEEPAKIEEAEEPVDETGVDAKDVELVVAQANVNRAKAVKALKENNSDVVNAIMSLTM
ncbi:nascent polypeptide-associated complex alpha subunit Egd2 [Schizosaccharomyces cryophilus OY26]|uniref:Nascent polypeptide-associated complex subunit alpha n=1 Tax=Schizosaccharomyces cryophilus (strain OY26 / ATCC MYA-4695 / CBS 11777 / NBRC 106824 / NRRL Y48691) TaxID=653667 RepID=S9VWS0_SCHCR|nr:nascent polypeptide-associated complex alpha subunit Egd2 [Schizosaccharomyces cryophilus OY26]EPY50689.1 nascent polypeptide-associated complex alpha subunit Egd2 [Schizosaccharomyces cryophilus OY26]